MARLKVDFITDEFEMAHGRRPSGRGSWAFSMKRRPDVSTRFETDPTSGVIWITGMYGEAKKEAAQKIRESAAAYGSTLDEVDLWVLS